MILPNAVMLAASLLADHILRGLFFGEADPFDSMSGFKQFLALRIVCFIIFIYNISKLIITAAEMLIRRYRHGRAYRYSDKFGILVTLRKASFSTDRSFVKQYFVRLAVFLLLCGIVGAGLFFSSFSKLYGKNIYDQILLISDAEEDERMSRLLSASFTKEMVRKTEDNAYVLLVEEDEEIVQCLLTDAQYQQIQNSELENFEVEYYTNTRLIAGIKFDYLNGLDKRLFKTDEEIELPVEITLKEEDEKILVIRPEMGNLEGRIWWYIEKDGEPSGVRSANDLYYDELTYKRKGFFEVTLVVGGDYKSFSDSYTPISNTVAYDSNNAERY